MRNNLFSGISEVLNEDQLTPSDSNILLRRSIGVVDGDEGVDLVNGGTSEKRRVGTGEAADRNNVLTLSLSIVFSC